MNRVKTAIFRNNESKHRADNTSLRPYAAQEETVSGNTNAATGRAEAREAVAKTRSNKSRTKVQEEIVQVSVSAPKTNNPEHAVPDLLKSDMPLCSMGSFSIFGNPEAFASTINLEKASVVSCVEHYIKYKMTETQDTRLYRRIIKIIKEIEQANQFTLMPIVVGDTFWLHWQEYLLHTKHLSGSTVLGLTSGLTTTLTWAARYGAKVSITLDNHDVNPFSKKPRISLNTDEVSRITYFDIDSAAYKLNLRPQLVRTLKRVRDHFVISCGLGQRFSDIKRMDKSCFTFTGTLRYQIVQQKTGNKAVVDINKMCPYPNVVSKLLEKYDYCAPYQNCIEDYNRYLHFLFKIAGYNDKVIHEYKDAGKIMRLEYEKWELITSHTARRTFITNAIKSGINSEYVRRASGHTSEKSFSRYILFGDDE